MCSTEQNNMGTTQFVFTWSVCLYGGLTFCALVLRVYHFNRAVTVSVSTSQRQMGLLMQWCSYVRPATAAAPVCLYCSTEREGENVKASLWVKSMCMCLFEWLSMCRHTMSRCVYVCIGRQMGIDVVNQEKLTCCLGFDELFSLFNPSPSIPHMLGNSQHRL